MTRPSPRMPTVPAAEVGRKNDVNRTLWRPHAVKTKLPAYTQVADQLRAAIFGGTLQVGDVLPGENELAQHFAVSRGTVREALRLLTSERFIITTRGVKGGSVVTHPSGDDIQEYLGATLGLLAGSGTASVDMIVEARELFEIPAAGLAAQRRDDEVIEHLQSAITMKKPDHRTALRGNHDFHILLVRATGNPLLEVMLRPMLSVLDAYLTPASPTIYSRIDKEHATIAARVKDGDVDGASSAMRNHLRTLREIYRAVIPAGD